MARTAPTSRSSRTARAAALVRGARGPQGVIAHRGVPGPDGGENTLPAFENAVAAGADLIEMDVRRSADGVFVLSHDDRVLTTRGRPLRISASTFDEIARTPLAAGGTVPSLAQAAAALRGRVRLVLDLKVAETEEDLAGEIRRLDLLDSALVCSLDRASLLRLTRCAPDLVAAVSYPKSRVRRAIRLGAAPVTAACLLAMRAALPRRMSRWLEETGAGAVMVNHAMVTRRFVRTMHALDTPVVAWTVNGAVRARHLFRLGIDAMTTDRPHDVARLRDAMAEKGEG